MASDLCNFDCLNGGRCGQYGFCECAQGFLGPRCEKCKRHNSSTKRHSFVINDIYSMKWQPFFSYNFLSINKFKSLNNTTTFSYYSFLVKYGKSCNKTREKRIWFISYISTEQFYNFYNSADIYLFVALRKWLRLFSDSYWWIFTFHSHVRPCVWE